MGVYGFCRCGERVERTDYPEHVLACPAHEEDSDATDDVDASSGAGRACPVGPAEVDQVRTYFVTGECEWSAGDGTTCADAPDAEIREWCEPCMTAFMPSECNHRWCETCSAENGEREAMVSSLASLVAFALLVDVSSEPDWADSARNILNAVGWEVDPTDWRDWDWSEGPRAAIGDVVDVLDEIELLRRQVGRFQFAAYEAEQVIGNLVENGPEQGFGYWNEAGHWQDGERIMRDLRALAWVDGLDAPEDAPCALDQPMSGGDRA